MEKSGLPPAIGPVAVFIQFYLPRPKTLPKKITLPAKRPDLDKLARAVLDGLTEGGAWLDDGQVVRLQAAKYYASESIAPGCEIEIMDVGDRAVARAAARETTGTPTEEITA